MKRVFQFLPGWLKRWRLSLFEKAILVNSLMLIAEALVGLWVTSHNLESHHYLIDTSFIVFATLLTLLINILLLRASFRPLFSLLATIREVASANPSARAATNASAAEISELARAFNSMLDRLEAARREQTSLILQAQEKEQRRIALELHDEAGQNLTALLIHTEILNQTFQTLLPECTYQQLEEELHQLNRLTQVTLENIRVLSQQLRPSVLDDLGLLPALRWLIEDSGQRLHLDVELQVDGNEACFESLPADYKITLFRIAQESLTNIARHAHANHVVISLCKKYHQLCLHIQDDGVGFDPTQHQPGLGTVGMRERATLLGGTLAIQSQINQGTKVQATLPLPATIKKT